MDTKISQEVVDAVESIMLRIMRDYQIYGMHGIATIPDPSLSQLVAMLCDLKTYLEVLEDLNSRLSNMGIVNAIINSRRKISLAEDLLRAVQKEDRDECNKIMVEIKKQR